MSEKNTAANLEDYLRWRGDLTFEQDGFNEVDNLLLCLLSYIDLGRIELVRSKDPADALSLFAACDRLTEEDEQRGLSTREYIPIMRQAAQTERFKDVALFGYESLHDESREMQFDAVSYLLPDGSVFAAYMGTDRSLVGWKEDFNMSFLSAVPAQERAAAYAAEIGAACPERPLRLGGHSKGGNLAVWAAAHLPELLQDRLLAAYNNDGPGFSGNLLDSEGYRRVESRIHTFIPESSIIGMLMSHAEDYEVIDSTNHAIMQHEPLSWVVMGNRFVHLGQRSQIGRFSDNVLREWVDSMDAKERETFIEALFDVVSQGGRIRSLEELRGGGLIGRAALLRKLADVDEEKKTVLLEGLRNLASDVREGLKAGAGEGLEAAKRGLQKLLPDWIR